MEHMFKFDIQKLNKDRKNKCVKSDSRLYIEFYTHKTTFNLIFI